MSENVIAEIRQELRQRVDEKTKASFQRFFKEQVTGYGVKTATVEKIARQHLPAIKALGKKRAFALCEELLKSDYMEEAFVACTWSYTFRDEYETGDFATFERWLEHYVNNWAKCDTLCNHTIGALVEKYPQFVEDLKRWAKSDSRWLRRAAAVTLIVPAKQGKFLKDALGIADILLEDKDDLVQKGYGWLLKDASIKHQQTIFDYVMENRKAMPRTALRYAIERMPAEMKKQAMARD